MTKKEMFAHIATVNASDAEIVDFCNHQIELLENRKSTSGSSKKDKENEALMDEVYDVITSDEFSEGGTATEIMNASETLSALSNQKVSALLRKMVDKGQVEKKKEGKKTLWVAV
jgi:hypothetical protein